MQILSLNFLLYTVGGIWRPIEWSSTGANFLYNVYTGIVLILEYFYVLTQLLDILLVVDNVDDLVSNTLLFMSVFVLVCKMTLIVIRRSAIINLVKILVEPPCKPQDEDEVAIQMKFDKFIRQVQLLE